MRKLVSLLLFGLTIAAAALATDPGQVRIPGPGGSPNSGWVVVQHPHNFSCAVPTGVTTVSCTIGTSSPGWTGSPQAGDTLVLASAIFAWGSTTAPGPTSASGDSSWTHCPACISPILAGNNFWNASDAWVIPSAAGGATSFTITWTVQSATYPGNLDVWLLDLRAPGSPVTIDASATATNNSCTSCVAPTLSLSSTNEYLLQVASVNDLPISVSSPYSSPFDLDTTNVYGGLAGAIGPPSGAGPTWSVSSSSGTGFSDAAIALRVGSMASAATPTFSPGGGSYSTTQSVSISTATSGCGPYIYWSTTDNPPTTADTLGTSVSVHASETVYAKVIGCPGYSNSSVGSASYSIGAGGTNACPTGATYLNASTETTVTLASLGVSTCYYASAGGSDSNSGATESSPWLHLPGMPNCSGNCAAVTPRGGYGFILRGGDSWHFGNSSASPYVGSGGTGWSVTWSGTSGTPIYWGVDPSWYSGGSWSRPILTGDNATSGTGVSACTYDEAVYTGLSYGSQRYNTFDNLEMTGFCWHGNQSNSNEHICCLNIIYGGQGNSTPSFNTLENFYFHGWTHETFSCSTSGGEPTGNCNGATILALGSNSSYEQGDIIANNVFDGQDTDQESICAMCFGGYDIHNNVFRYLANAVVTNNTHVFHDNLLEYLHSAGDGVSHTNATKFNSEWAGVNADYNNVWRDDWSTGTCEVTQWMMPSSTDYDFNNLIYDMGCTANFFDLASTYGTGWTSNIFNNAWVIPGNGPDNGPPASTTANFGNNQCLVNNAAGNTTCFTGAGTVNYQTDLVQTPATASGQGYTDLTTFAYSPQSGSAGTVGAGTNYTSPYCATLLGSSDIALQAAGRACEKDTTYACSYNSSTHELTCPARTPNARPSSGDWDVGPYEY